VKNPVSGYPYSKTQETWFLFKLMVLGADMGKNPVSGATLRLKKPGFYLN